MGVLDHLSAARVAELVADLVAADHGEGAGLGEFDLWRDADSGRFVGDFYQARLSSVFQPVFSADGTRVIGHTARARCVKRQNGGNGPEISPWGVFSTITGDAALVRLDRLCRALHLLNYFEQAQPGWLLWLRVETRLLASVKQDHGKVFGRIIEHYCGIPTSRVVIEVPAETADQPAVLAAALANYRARGYRTALNHHARLATDVLRFADFVRIEATSDTQALVQKITQAHAGGAAAVVKKVESARLQAVALAAGADGIQGFFPGAPGIELSDARSAESARAA